MYLPRHRLVSLNLGLLVCGLIALWLSACAKPPTSHRRLPQSGVIPMRLGSNMRYRKKRGGPRFAWPEPGNSLTRSALAL